MRWPTYFILAYLVLAVQLGLEPYVAYHGAAPNLVLLAAIFIAIQAPRDTALLACFLLGVLQDMTTQQQPGLFAFSYGLVALFVVATQQMVYKGHPLTHFSLALGGGLIVAAVMLLQSLFHAPPSRVTDSGAILPAIRLRPTLLLERALYTALLAPFLLAMLQKTRGLFGFQPGRRKGRSW